jgi:hypothetical protein
MCEYGPMPPGLLHGHHNNLAGRDDFKHVAAMIVFGRTMPKPQDVEQQAMALTGRWVAGVGTEKGWYPKRRAYYELADGTWGETEFEYHPAPIAEQIRWRSCEGELQQIEGRPRGVNRAADWSGGQPGPVVIYRLTNVPLPGPVDKLITLDDLWTTPAQRMLAAGGVAFESPSDAAAAYRGLWTETAAKQALLKEPISGAQGLFSPYIVTYRDFRPCAPEIPPPTPLRRIRYQKAGQRQRPAVAWVDLAVCPRPRARLTELFGPLALYDDGSAGDQSPIARMVRSGRFLFSPTDAYGAYGGDLFASPNAAKEVLAAFSKAVHPADPLDAVRQQMEEQGLQPVTVSYRPAGRGQQTRRALFSAEAAPTARAWLEAALGSLAEFHVDGPVSAPIPEPEPISVTMPPSPKPTPAVATPEPAEESCISVVEGGYGELLEPAALFAPKRSFLLPWYGLV